MAEGKTITLTGGGLLRMVTVKDAAATKNCAVLVIPGGGYHWCYPGEMDVPARAFARAGYDAWVLEYATQPLPLRELPLQQAKEAIACLHASGTKKIAVCGFSAGAHLAVSTAFLNEDPATVPDAVVLCYPVITGGEFAHKNCVQNLCGDDPDLRARFSLEEQVKPGLPPFFIWQARTDEDVPYQNSLLLANALAVNDVPFEYHLFGSGGHGTVLCTEETGTADPHNAHWFALCLEWLEKNL